MDKFLGIALLICAILTFGSLFAASAVDHSLKSGLSNGFLTVAMLAGFVGLFVLLGLAVRLKRHMQRWFG